MARAFKAISYRGGIVSFRVPESWTEHYEPDGGGEFFEDAPDSPTLRLNVLTFRGARPGIADVKSAISKKAQHVELLRSGVAIGRYAEHVTDDDGTPLLITYWELAQSLPPDHLRLVVFSCTITAGQENDAAIRDELALLDTELRAAVLAPELGSVQ